MKPLSITYLTALKEKNEAPQPQSAKSELREVAKRSRKRMQRIQKNLRKAQEGRSQKEQEALVQSIEESLGRYEEHQAESSRAAERRRERLEQTASDQAADHQPSQKQDQEPTEQEERSEGNTTEQAAQKEAQAYEDLAQALANPQNSSELVANCQEQLQDLLSRGKTPHTQQAALTLHESTADLLKQLKGQYRSLSRAYDTSVDASEYMTQQLGQQIRSLKQLEQAITQTEQSLQTLCERFELEVPDVTEALPISKETLVAAFNQVLDYTTPGSELIKIALGTTDTPQRWEEYLELAASTALDFIPGGKALKSFKGASAKLGLAKIKSQLAQQVTKEARKIAKGIKKLIKNVGLPAKGKIRFIPRPVDVESGKILQKNGLYVDKFGNVWKKGASRTKGQAFEWDVKLSAKGKLQLGHLTKGGNHINVSLDGRITH